MPSRTLIHALLLPLAAAGALAAVVPAPSVAQPNILHILTDDMG